MQVYSKYISDNESGFLIDQRHIYNNKSKTQSLDAAERVIQLNYASCMMKKNLKFYCSSTPSIDSKKEPNKDSMYVIFSQRNTLLNKE
jgi:hypothetical protein